MNISQPIPDKEPSNEEQQPNQIKQQKTSNTKIFQPILIALTILFAMGLSCYSLILPKSYRLYLIEDIDAKCLDGSQPSFYYASGFGDGSQKFIVYFSGGGWIGGETEEQLLNDASKRSKTNIGSSKDLEQHRQLEGILDRKFSKNPHFYSWNSIYINYCDGTGYQGHKTDPVEVNGENLYFRGDANTKATLASIWNEFGFKDAKYVLITGCSAGGLAVFNWANYIQNLFNYSNSTTVVGAPDSGLFQDMIPYNQDDKKQFRNFYFKQFMKIVNYEIDPPNTKCIDENQQNKWKCLMSPYLVNYVDIPLFFIQSMYDLWSIENILLLDCASQRSLIQCSDEEQAYIEKLHIGANLIMTESILKYKNWGGWSTSCINHWQQNLFLIWSFEHISLFDLKFHNVPSLSRKSIATALNNWITGNDQGENNIDQYKWPDNKSCQKIRV